MNPTLKEDSRIYKPYPSPTNCIILHNIYFVGEGYLSVIHIFSSIWGRDIILLLYFLYTSLLFYFILFYFIIFYFIYLFYFILFILLYIYIIYINIILYYNICI